MKTLPRTHVIINDITLPILITKPMPLTAIMISSVILSVIPRSGNSNVNANIIGILMRIMRSRCYLYLRPPITITISVSYNSVHLIYRQPITIRALLQNLNRRLSSKLCNNRRNNIIRRRYHLVRRPQTLCIIAVALRLPYNADPIRVRRRIRIIYLTIRSLITRSVSRIPRHYNSLRRCISTVLLLYRATMRINMKLSSVRIYILALKRILIRLQRSRVTRQLPVATRDLSVSIICEILNILFSNIRRISDHDRDNTIAYNANVLARTV